MLEYISIGQIVNTHGIRGEVKVYPLTDDIKRFDKVDRVYVEENDELMPLDVTNVKYMKNMVIIKFKTINDINSAEKLRNKYIKVHRKDAVKLPKDAYLICDLIGLTVMTKSGEILGKVKDVFQTGSNDVFVVKSEEREILIPGLKSIFKKVDLEAQEIIVELPEGLI
ncbi:ribosome maturation factor RimM [Lutispora thermophila]|mgnify:CR=1 FL=1|uniref:Ribosome maturation factor RimM n=1 Tax=Lutispora thermophila DSM 19022 TaxID=1122184 RepID=A0A1M6G591_9FIRM|nr:ribosome maturation factor RimM [Lutispora thermophila]SHJ05168.1 16S rRNA processing protein RimM [Lutispora thermophila DSM 19022]